VTGLGTYTNGSRGGIVYLPAYKGASYGNMSVNFGDLPASDDPADILSSFVAYLGAYLFLILY
jgi:hypothetical protein